MKIHACLVPSIRPQRRERYYPASLKLYRNLSRLTILLPVTMERKLPTFQLDVPVSYRGTARRFGLSQPVKHLDDIRVARYFFDGFLEGFGRVF